MKFERRRKETIIFVLPKVAYIFKMYSHKMSGFREMKQLEKLALELNV